VNLDTPAREEVGADQITVPDLTRLDVTDFEAERGLVCLAGRRDKLQQGRDQYAQRLR
jgi:hypothetical protein